MYNRHAFFPLLHVKKSATVPFMGARVGRYDRDRSALQGLDTKDIGGVLWATLLQLRHGGREAPEQQTQSWLGYAARRLKQAVKSTSDRIVRHLSRWSTEQLERLAREAHDLLIDRLDSNAHRIDRSFNGFRPNDQRPLKTGDMLLSTAGAFKHGLIVLSDAVERSGFWVCVIAHCHNAGCNRTLLWYPKDIEDMGGRGAMFEAQALGASGNPILVVRARAVPEALRRRAAEIAERWTDPEGELVRYGIGAKVLKPGACLGRGRVDMRAAHRYMDLAKDDGDASLADLRLMCSEMVFAAWVAAIGTAAEDHGADPEEWISRLLPIEDPRGCWPRSIWKLPTVVPNHWTRVGPIACPVLGM